MKPTEPKLVVGPSLDALTATLEARPWPAVPPLTPWSQVRERWPVLRASCEAAATHVARTALGLPAPPSVTVTGYLATEDLVARITKAHAEIYMVFGPGRHPDGSERASARWTAMMALLVGVHGEWDLVASMTGGALPTTVSRDLALRDNYTLLVRHLAVVARTRATKYAATTMRDLRARIVRALADTNPEAAEDAAFDVRFALVAARIYFERAVQVHDVGEAVREWLAGAELLHEPASRVREVADGADVRATIFERFLPELSDTHAIASAQRVLEIGVAPFGSTFLGTSGDSAAVFLHVAAEPKPAGWESRVDPLVAAYLGGLVDPRRQARSLALLKPRARLFRAVSNAALAVPANLAHALLARDDSAVLVMTGGGSLAPFAPGRIFGDDVSQLGRYLLAARKTNAAPAVVMPAWLDFLACRSPATSRIDLSWRVLLLFQSIITTELGGQPDAATGDALRMAITGAG
ncbi:hypothetical protein BH11MYX1_BH11MYX1_57420 [soil metagenome]